ncbi:hypothetical protein IGI04_028890 [Brassica rapa subsp. trilocularis]|uniref:Uncharacterized protein n=1 Tax=Brassica rapa subsp. trilocularis TaxID=1813537 RepID=A0ABQ7L382_BRACM|nr:hypothetical protein IGI04_028890 [Brassica rapa subsp. trilocularis]
MEDVRRGGVTNRFSNKLSLGKSKKGMFKKLGLSDAEKMMRYKCPSSDLETDVSSKKKMKKSNLPRKDTNGVDHHASVPRKLRSATKKRNLEYVKKKNQEMDAKANVPESISKDEKEVAETLYGLADMFTDTNSIDSDPFLSDGKETSKVDSILVVETASLEPAASFLSSPKPKQIDEEPLQQQDPNQGSLTGLKQNSSVNVSDAALSTRAFETKVATSDIDYKSNGLALWPGLSSTTQSSSHVLSEPSSTKLPHWMMGQAVSPTKNASLLSEQLRVRTRKFKKCASHIYICRLIKALQTSKSSPVALLNQTEERSLKTSSKRYQNPHLLDLGKTHNPKPVQENMTQLGLELYAPHTTQKQNYDFLSLLSQSRFPFPNSFPQYPISGAYNSQLSPAPSSHQMQQMSPYLASRFQTAYNANQQQQLQLQKRLWANQFRQPTSRNSMPPLSNQHSKSSLSLNLTSIQPLHVASSPRYINNISQQQYRLMAASAAAMSMSHRHNNNPSGTVMNRQEHHFPLIYEDTRTPLQLLCNEQS